MSKPSESGIGLEICVLTDFAGLSETHEAFRAVRLHYNIIVVTQSKKNNKSHTVHFRVVRLIERDTTHMGMIF